MKVFTVDNANYDAFFKVLCPICTSLKRKCDEDLCNNHYVSAGLVVSFFSSQEEDVYKSYLTDAPYFKDHTRLNLTNDFWRCREFTMKTMINYLKETLNDPKDTIGFDELVNRFVDATTVDSFKTDYLTAIEGAIVLMIISGDLKLVFNDSDDIAVSLP